MMTAMRMTDMWKGCDDPNEPIMEGSDDDFEDLVEELNEVEEGTQLTVQGLF